MNSQGSSNSRRPMEPDDEYQHPNKGNNNFNYFEEEEYDEVNDGYNQEDNHLQNNHHHYYPNNNEQVQYDEDNENEPYDQQQRPVIYSPQMVEEGEPPSLSPRLGPEGMQDSMTRPNDDGLGYPLGEDYNDDEGTAMSGEDAALDLAELEQLQEEAERMKGLGNKHMAAQEYTRAYNAYSAALQLSPVGPSSHVFLSNRAASLLSLKRYSAAAVDARRAVALAPTFGKAHARLGQALYFLKQYQGAVEAYEDALRYEDEGSNGAVTRAYLMKAKEKMALQEEKERRKALAGGGGEDGGTVGEESAFQTVAYSVVTDKDGRGVASGRMTSERLSEVAKDEKEKQMSSIVEDKEVNVAPRGSPLTPFDEPEKRASPTMMYVETGPMGGPAQRRMEIPQDKGVDTRANNQTGEDNGDGEPDPDFDEALRLQRRATQYLSYKKYRKAVDDFSAALFLVPDDPILTPQLHVGRAHALNGQERYESAKNDALMALRHILRNGEEDVSAAEAYSVLGKSLYYTKDYHGAIEALEECDRVWKLNGGKLSVFDEAYLEQCHQALDAGLGVDHADGVSLGGGASVISNGVKSVVSTLKEGKPLSNIPKLKPPRFVSREQALQNAHDIPPMPKNWPQQSPTSPSSVATGPERSIIFLSDAMGIKLNRGNDGLIRVISVADLPPGSPILRKGNIETGDLVREAGGVDLRRPITATMWGDTVALIKMAPRPLTLIVAKEITSQLANGSRKSPRVVQQRFDYSSAAIGEESVTDFEERMKKTTSIVDESVPASSEITPDAKLANTCDNIDVPFEASGISEDDNQQNSPKQTEVIDEDKADTNSANGGPEGKSCSQIESDSSDHPHATSDDENTCVHHGSTPKKEEVENMSSSDVGTEDRSCSQIKNELSDHSHPTSDGKNILAHHGDTPKKEEVENIPLSDEIDTLTGDEKSESLVVEQEVAIKPDSIGAPVEDGRSNDINENQVSDNPTHQSLHKTILFDDRTSHIQALDDSSDKGQNKLKGYINERWIASQPALKFSGVVYKVAQEKKLFWSTESYVERTLAIFTLPSDTSSTGEVDIILILRKPVDTEEVARLLPTKVDPNTILRKGISFLKNNYFIAEHVIDPMTCKLRLSQLTTPTSIPYGMSYGMSAISKDHDGRKDSFFELITPIGSISLSAIPIQKNDKQNERVHYGVDAIIDTTKFEDAVSHTLLSAHSLMNSTENVDLSGTHQVVLGTLHSYVVSGNDKMLQDALTTALSMQKPADVHAVTKLDSSIIDSRDLNWKSPLHYACEKRRPTTISLLVNAGANCTITTSEAYTPLHLCAERLDDKGLSIILSATYPIRPDPNPLDSCGRTPMYLAALRGNDAPALARCLSALNAWGGYFLPVGENKECKRLLHPISYLSSRHDYEQLKIVLSYVNFHFPLSNSELGGISLSAQYDYPIHAAMISLRNQICSSKNNDTVASLSSTSLEENIKKTIQTLVDHGFEPNERLEGIKFGKTDDVRILNQYFGFSPLQILAVTAKELNSVDSNDEFCTRAMNVIKSTADVLILNGSRTNLPSPPKSRLDRETPPGCISYTESLDSNMESDPPIIDRDRLKMDDDNMLSLFGGKERVKASQTCFAVMTKPTNGTQNDALNVQSDLSSVSDSAEPGGSDSNSCAICWSEFGVISNRKQFCQVSTRYVCNDCSSKRLVEGGRDVRVSDGQFLLAKAKESKRTLLNETNLQPTTADKRKEPNREAKNRLSLGLFGNKSTNHDANSKQSTAERVTSTVSSLNQTRNAVLERGSKLEGLADKTEALSNTSLDFANMAKELNRQQNSWW